VVTVALKLLTGDRGKYLGLVLAEGQALYVKL
jgi:hypothetical protein